jgi:hypothetical protein
MKKVFFIALSLLMMVAMIHISVATHYCGGKEVASIVSLTGKIADCGMGIEDTQLPVSGTYLGKHCCENIVLFYSIDSNYTPSFNVFSGSYQTNFQTLSIPLELSISSVTLLKALYGNVGPPGALMSSNVDLSDICVFRI